MRGSRDGPTGDVAVDEAIDGLGDTDALFREAFQRRSLDGDGLPLEATVHYGLHYDNAFWDGTHIVMGDGDGQIFQRFTASLSVLGHELSHGLVQYTSNFVYRGQSGALNESVCDVFGALVEQHRAGQSVEEASWLIGEGLFTDAVEGAALRSLAAPGTAFDDDVIGKDPQPAHIDGFIDTTDDHGGGHLNSGIPNHAFYLVAAELGGHAWERAGRIWFDTVTRGAVPADCDFVRFAVATIDAADARFGADSAERAAVASAWEAVGALP